MDYEKKYNEALERAKEIKEKIMYSHLSTESCKAVSEYIDTIIPELAESEDERIIDGFRTLLDGIKRSQGLTLNKVPLDKCYSWLEKQKEASKAIEAVERIDKYIDEHLANAHDMKDSDPDKKYYRGLDDAFGKMAIILQDVYSEKKQKESLRDFIDDFPYSDEQKEQKPKEQCVDVIKMSTLLAADRLASAEMTGRLKERKEILENPEKYGLCKPAECEDCAMYLSGNCIHPNGKCENVKSKQEWSEEDKRKLNRIYSIIGWAMDEHAFSSCKKLLGDKEGVELQDFLRSIAKPKQEWSEEDEKMLRTIISDGSRGVELDSKQISFLKSLRPSWKPSEEQMKVFDGLCHNYILDKKDYKVLESLYEQLKKL